MNIVLIIRQTLLFIVLAIFFAVPSYAQYGGYGQYGQYGGGGAPAQAITVDKLVGKSGVQTKGGLTDREYVDNLSVSDKRFRPGDEVFFQIKVKNTSNSALSNVVLTDTLPSFIEPMQGPGSFNAANRLITVNIDTLQPAEERVFFLRTQIFPQDQIPADKGLFCLTNTAVAKSGNLSDDDTSQFCIEKQVIGVSEVPTAGPEYSLVLLGGEASLLLLGLYLRKRTLA